MIPFLRFFVIKVLLLYLSGAGSFKRFVKADLKSVLIFLAMLF